MEYYVYEDSPKPKTIIKKDLGVRFSMSKVLLWLALGLLLTGVIALTLPDFCIACCGSDDTALYNCYRAFIITASVLMFFSSFVMWLPIIPKDTPWTIVSYLLFTISVGWLLSSVFLWVKGINNADAIKTLCISFFIAAGSYLVVGLIGTLSKKNLNVITPVLFSMLMGIVILSLFSVFDYTGTIYIITDIIIFSIILVVTAIDFYNVKRMASLYPFHNSTSLAIYCAYNLYLDFIYIFVQILFYVVYFRNRS
ncbi:MAG: Bax inhibitor-1 family protein [Bacilli bacterium]|jgi:FtsH-binding integral membrane protein